jgi:hypothetical protein
MLGTASFAPDSHEKFPWDEFSTEGMETMRAPEILAARQQGIGWEVVYRVCGAVLAMTVLRATDAGEAKSIALQDLQRVLPPSLRRA